MTVSKAATLLFHVGGVLAFLLSSSAAASPLRGRNEEEGYRLPGTGNVTSEIYGGTAASAGEFPAYALLCYNGATSCGGCGGGLVSSQHVLTAAHCIVDSNGNSLGITGVRIGASQTNSDGTFVAVSSFTVHPDLDFSETSSGSLTALRNDVCILTLASAVSGVTPFSYNRDSAYPSTDLTSVVGIGYGRFSTSSSISSILRKNSMSFRVDAACSGSPVAADDEVICAQGSNTGACPGDSGGPLLDTSGLILGMWSFVAHTCGVSAVSNNWAFDSWNYATWIDGQISAVGVPTPAPTAAPTPSSCFNCFTVAWNSLVSFWDDATIALEASASRLGFGDNVAV